MEGMKKGRKIALFLAITVLAVLAAAYGANSYFVRSLRTGDGFLQGTVLNGRNVSGKTPEEAAALISEDFKEREVVLTEDGKEVLRLPLTKIGYRVKVEKLEEVLTDLLAKEKEDTDSILDGLINGNRFLVKFSYGVNPEAFEKEITVGALSAPRRENVNAKILYDEEKKECYIKPEVQGTELKDEDLQTWLRQEIDSVLKEEQAGDSGDPADPAGGAASSAASAAKKQGSGQKKEKDAEDADGVVITREIPASLYIPPEKTRKSRSVKEKCEILNRYADETITYLFGGVTETLDFGTFMNWIRIKDGEVTVKEDKVAEYVRGLAEKYETRYRDRVFTTTWGNQITFPATLNEYGYTILEDQEAAQLIQDILSGESVEREPVYMTCGPWGDPLYLYRNGMDDLAGTYVEVSISAQHLWYYINGQLFIESDVVTGDVNEGMGTATGVFPLAFKESPATLRGGEGKKKYVTKVQYWMPFYEGQGLHDAWWKSVFGGNEYMGNGSHGCVNLPPSVAESIYNNIVPGTAIVIYN